MEKSIHPMISLAKQLRDISAGIRNFKPCPVVQANVNVDSLF